MGRRPGQQVTRIMQAHAGSAGGTANPLERTGGGERRNEEYPAWRSSGVGPANRQRNAVVAAAAVRGTVRMTANTTGERRTAVVRLASARPSGQNRPMANREPTPMTTLSCR